MSEEINENEEFDGLDDVDTSSDPIHDITPVSGMYENWFLDYASYVILERAVPSLTDGLKPVQRRIMHSMKEMDDGRFNKVANVIGHTMQYHPHGDMAIGDAIVHMGQKELLIETQGNWGDIRTGDRAAASRYIEARLSKFALAVLFNPQTTDWQLSYDGRKKEPVNLPAKFPLLLAQGVEGIAVGLATKIMPHNFIELIDASIKYLRGRKFELYPDFLTGGMMDISNYNDGLKGGKVRLRAIIDTIDKRTLKITSIPYATTTSSLIDSILKANDQGKLKVKQVVDNTAAEVEILVHLPANVSPDITIDALYAFTDCEVSISPNACVIVEDRPYFIGVTEILKRCTDQSVELLKMELEIRRGELMEKILFSSLERIFIQEEMYIQFKEYDNRPDLYVYLDKRFEPFKPQFYREIGDEDFERLTRIPMIRITRFDSDEADEKLKNLQDELDQVNHHLANLIDYAVDYYKDLKTRFGKGRERRTEIRTFETISATVVAATNAKLYINRSEGFIGTGLKKDEFISDCSDIDDIIVFRKDGKFLVTKIQDKVFVGKNIIYAAVFKRGDERMVYNMIYFDKGSGRAMVKRFQILGVTRDKEYDLTKKVKGSRVLYFTANPNGEAEVVNVALDPKSGARNSQFDYDFAELAIKGRGAGGNVLTKYPVKKVTLKSEGVSTLAGVDIWYDPVIGRINTDGHGTFLGEFNGDDKILVIFKEGDYELTSFELTNRYEQNKILLIEKFEPERVISMVHYDGEKRQYFVKRFLIETTSIGRKFRLVSEHHNSRIEVVSTGKDPRIELVHKPGLRAKKLTTIYNLMALVEVKGWKAQGNRLTKDYVTSVNLLPEPEPEEVKEEQVNIEEDKGTEPNPSENEE